jgi:hypothetical protein
MPEVKDYRKDFEVAMLFRGDLTQGREGFLRKDIHGKYISPMAERLYMGYEAAKRNDESRLRRFDPERFIGNGHMAEINMELAKQGIEPINEAIVRAVLRIAAGWPA